MRRAGYGNRRGIAENLLMGIAKIGRLRTDRSIGPIRHTSSATTLALLRKDSAKTRKKRQRLRKDSWRKKMRKKGKKRQRLRKDSPKKRK